MNTASSRKANYEYAQLNYLKEKMKDFVLPFIFHSNISYLSQTHSGCLHGVVFSVPEKGWNHPFVSEYYRKQTAMAQATQLNN